VNNPFADAISTPLPELNRPERSPVDEIIQGAAARARTKAIPYEYQHDVFVVFRPWENCPRCKAQLESGDLALPDEGDHVCPHTRRADYHALWRKIFAGDLKFISRKEETLKNGVTRVSIEWGVPQAKAEELKGPSLR
jgi:hypothetical protein